MYSTRACCSVTRLNRNGKVPQIPYFSKPRDKKKTNFYHMHVQLHDTRLDSRAVETSSRPWQVCRVVLDISLVVPYLAAQSDYLAALIATTSSITHMHSLRHHTSRFACEMNSYNLALLRGSISLQQETDCTLRLLKSNAGSTQDH